MLTMLRKTVLMVAVLSLLCLAWATPSLEAKNFLWSINSPDGGQSYIMGSIHLAYPGLYPLPETIMDAYEKSSKLVVEINTSDLPPQALAVYVARYGLDQDQKPLLQRLTPSTAALLKNSGFYQPGLDSFKPWLAALSIQLQVLEENGFEAKYGLDEYFIGLAKGQGRKILDLETLQEQMEALINMTPEESDLFLRSVILEMDQLPQTIKGFLDTWRDGNVAEFTQIFFSEADKYPQLKPLLKKLIVDRNHSMAATIHQLLQKGDGYFIVVGAGHLVGEDSIQSLLTNKGYTLTQQ